MTLNINPLLHGSGVAEVGAQHVEGNRMIVAGLPEVGCGSCMRLSAWKQNQVGNSFIKKT